jgi:tetratricopeptide (TPR) repeat protein
MESYIPHPQEPALEAALHSLRSGRGSAYAIIGPPGFGKTTLLDRVESAARSNPTIRTVRIICSPSSEPTVEDSNALHADLPSLIDVSATNRQLPSDRAFLAAAELLDGLGVSDYATPSEGHADLTMDEGRIARAGIGAVITIIKDRVFPQWLSDVETIGEALQRIVGISDRGEFDTRRLLDLLYVQLDAAVRQMPTLLLVDDAHFIDPQSCELLFKLAPNLSRRPCVLVVTARDREMREFAAAEPWHPLSGAVSNGIAQGWLKEIHMERWGPATIAHYAATRFPGLESERAFVHRLSEATQGHPLFVAEVLDWLESDKGIVQSGKTWKAARPLESVEIPRRVEEIILQQLRRADDTIRATIERASIEGEQFHFSVLSALTKPLDHDDLRARLAAAERYHGLIRTLVDAPRDALGGLYRFSHELIHDFVYSRIPRESLRVLHGLVANELVRVSADNPRRFASEIVHHSRVAGQLRRVVSYSLPTAEQAMAVFDWRTALAYAGVALQVASGTEDIPAETVLGLKWVRSEALYRQQDWNQAVTGLQDVVATAAALGSHGTQGDALCLLSHIGRIRGDNAGALDHAREALALATESRDPTRQLAALMCWHRAMESWPDMKRTPVYQAEIQPKLRAILAEADSRGDRRLAVRALRWLARAYRMTHDDSESRDALERGLRLAREVGDFRSEVEMYYLKIDFETEGLRSEAVIAAYDASVAAARLSNDRTLLSNVLCNYGSRLKDLRVFPAARAKLEEALQIGLDMGSAELISMAYGNLASLHERAGEWDQAQEQHRRHLAIATAVGNIGGRLTSELGLARATLHLEGPSEALTAIEAISWPTAGKFPESVDALFLKARAFNGLGQREEAAAVIAEGTKVARERGDKYWIVQGLLTRAELAREGLQSDSLATDIAEAVVLSEELHRRWPASKPLEFEFQRSLTVQDQLARDGLIPKPATNEPPRRPE